MSACHSDILRRISGVNLIPSGRQLPRTPPATVVRRISFSDADFGNSKTGATNQEDQYRALCCSHPEPNEDAPLSMLKGMKGYQLTQSDLEFIKRMKEEQLVKKLQGDQEEVQRLLKNKMMALELAWASTEKAQAELGKIPSGEKLTEGIKMVMTSPRMGLTDVDAKSPLSMALVTIENFQTAMKEKQKDLDNHKQMLEMLKQEPEETVNFEKELAIEQLISQRLKQTLSDLKSEARPEEEYKSLQMNTLKAPADDLEHAQATTSEVERSGKGRKRRAKELPDTAIKANSTRRKRADNQMKVKDDHSDQIKSKALEGTQHTGPRRSKRIANMQIQNK